MTLTSACRALDPALAIDAPDDCCFLRAFPRSQQLSEFEARYTAGLTSYQVLRLFRRYCGTTQPAASLSQQP